MSKLAKSPLAPEGTPTLLSVPGVELGALAAGLRYKGRRDLMMVVFESAANVAGVFTTSKTPAAPIDWCRAALASGKGARALVVNAGNANAFTGRKGAKACQDTAEAAANIVGCTPEQITLASTGVIGEPLNAAPITRKLKHIYAGKSANMWQDGAEAIMTTDTFPKGTSSTAAIDGHTVTITGIAKGSGMIAPDMATMLGFVFTNAPVTSECLQAILKRANETSFNAITVDGDTSTNDCVIAFATGKIGLTESIDDPDDPRLADFCNQFEAVMRDLAHQIVRDGEGAQKFVEITVAGAEDDIAARTIAKSVANSPLVKTAIAGEDPNWGRLVMAVGKSGEKADRDALKIWIGDQLVAHKGMVHNRYQEELAAEHMAGQEITLKIDVGVGAGRSTVWTCDLTHQYIDINADYRS